MKISLIAIAVLMFNIPLGYWRANIKKYAIQWILAIHIPVLFVILLRIYLDLGFALYTYPVLIVSFFIGQFIGGKIHDRRESMEITPITSCLVMDFYRKSR